VSYSWEFVEAAVMLPMTLQSMTRLAEITQRINNAEGNSNAEETSLPSHIKS